MGGLEASTAVKSHIGDSLKKHSAHMADAKCIRDTVQEIVKCAMLPTVVAKASEHVAIIISATNKCKGLACTRRSAQ